MTAPAVEDTRYSIRLSADISEDEFNDLHEAVRTEFYRFLDAVGRPVKPYMGGGPT